MHRTGVVAFLLTFSSLHGQPNSMAARGAMAAEAGGVAGLPANKWTRLPCKKEQGYVWSAMVYAPSRGQVLHWGAVASGREQRDDVRAFDAAVGDWVSDCPAASAKLLQKAMESGQGIRIGGKGTVLETGQPAPSWVVNGVAYDSKRKQLVYVMKGLMAAYDPETRKWSDLKAETELTEKLSLCPDQPYGWYEHGLRPEQNLKGQRVPGGPPVYGAGVCYDPVNDEHVLSPHWGGQNNDLRSLSGRVSAHSGTWVYSYRDNLWRRVSGTLGSEDMRIRRRETLGAIGKASAELDEAWVQRRRLDAGALGELEAVLERALRVEPPARCGAPMVYDSKNKVIILFGGQSGLVRSDLASPGRAPEPGGLNDTWLYDVSTRQWREALCANRPPEQKLPKLVYDEASGLALLVTIPGRYAGKGEAAVWAFDAAIGEWTKRVEEAWAWGGTDWASLGFDPKSRMLLLAREGQEGQETFAMRLDLAAAGAKPAPVWQAPAAIVAQQAAADDAEWLAKLKALPANTWVAAKTPREPEDRGWGILACDAARGLVFYFGGGHSTYQVNDVAIYAVGANRWCHAAGDQNFPAPSVDWDGCTMSTRGGPPAGHQRNSYVAWEGRMFTFAGTHSRRWDAEIAKESGGRVAWFYDLDRGGVWRQREIAEVTLEPGVPGSYGRLHVVHPSGKIYGFAGHLEPYDGRFFEKEAYLSCYDMRENRLSVRKIPEPAPGWVGEGRPFCMMADRNQVFFYEWRKDGGHNTWVYDLKDHRFIALNPKRQPPGDARTVEYVEEQGCVLAIVGEGEQWVYSVAKNDWAPLPLQSAEGKVGFARPYAQMVWVEKYGVMVNVHGRTYVMRPDLSRVIWE